MSHSAAESQVASRTLYHLRIPEGKIFGPVTAEQLDQWVAEGRIDDQCQIRIEGGTIWEKPSRWYPVLDLPQELGAGIPFHSIRVQRQAMYYTQSRGKVALIFSLVGILGACPVFSIAAWSIAYADLQQLAAEQISPDAKPVLLWAYNLGMFGSLAWGLLFLAFLLVSLVRFLL